MQRMQDTHNATVDWDTVTQEVVETSMKSWVTRTCQWTDIVLHDLLAARGHEIHTFHMIKFLQMKVGYIWQRLIGRAHGVLNLEQGHPSGLDVMTDGKGTFARGEFAMELKNAFNSDNSSSRKANLGKLCNWVRVHPKYQAVYGTINCQGGIKGDWSGEDRLVTHDGVCVRHMSGMKLLEFVFGIDGSKEVLTALRIELRKYVCPA